MIKLLFMIICLSPVLSRIHKLVIQDDARKYIALSTFGFYKGGVLDVRLTSFSPQSSNPDDKYGFTLDRTLSDAMNPNMENLQNQCVLTDSKRKSEASIKLLFNFKNHTLDLSCTPSLKDIKITNQDVTRESVGDNLPKIYQQTRRNKRDSDLGMGENEWGPCSSLNLPLNIGGKPFTQFSVLVDTDEQQGLYNLYFHNCPSRRGSNAKVNFTVEIEEKNLGNFLSAGEMPLPALYFMMAILFFLSGCFWCFLLSKTRHTVFKIHYLMGLLVFLKSFSLLFHAINYHFIQTKGAHIAAWAILYYIIHLLKGAVLFIVIVLVGTGWTFIKHILSEKDKRIFMLVIPLQVLANVAEIIIEESEEGNAEHRTWRDIFMLVDLVCCGAIIFPVVWSIRHLQDAAHIDGKAANNLRKLKLFRHFYIMIVAYIYFTRIIVYLLQVTIPFQYEWVDEMFREMATYVFFFVTGYKFRPASENPYFQVNVDDDDEEVDIIVSQTGMAEGLKKVHRVEKDGGREEEELEEDKRALISRHESSYDLD